MTSVACLVAQSPDNTTGLLDSLKECRPVKQTALLQAGPATTPAGSYTTIEASSLWSKSAIVDTLKWLEQTRADYLLFCLSSAPLLTSAGVQRLANCCKDSDAPLVYGDYFDRLPDNSLHNHPLLDYQVGSLRDDFDFGQLILLNGKSLRGLSQIIEAESPDLQYGGWYDLRLRLSQLGQLLHVSEPLYQLPKREIASSGQKMFDYVDPQNRAVQLEMEQVATAHLKRIGALLDSPNNALVEDGLAYPQKASVVIPVKNRARTIGDAVDSALNQKTTFDFNVIVVDNFSDDGTTQIIEEMAKQDKRLVHLIPTSNDLAIGGCWNEAIYSQACGRFAVQLDSDDIYDGTSVLERVIHEFDQNPYALVIGSYTTVNFDLAPLSPGLIDHKEWSDSNGPNNALRIAGLGAPRAFHVPTLRTIGFPNVSYGEDYAVVLQLCRSYRVGRIYDSLYWCRRWEENSDSSLSLELSNRYAAYKDKLRTIEIAARQRSSKTKK
jgi:glycosyl transferase family 2